MSEEGGWDLDFPGDKDVIGEPDAASIDEIPSPMVTLDKVLEQKGDVNYWYLVESENNKNWKRWYEGHIVIDAIAAYTTAILDGDEYVMLESLRMPTDGSDKDRGINAPDKS